jgi:hypothetical protein
MTKNAALGVSLAFLSALIPAPAMAANATSCVVTSVGWQAKAGPRYLYLTCQDGSTHLAYVNSSSNTSGCNADIDSLRMFESLATAAKLSGRTLSIFWTQQSCQNGSSRIIEGMELD